MFFVARVLPLADPGATLRTSRSIEKEAAMSRIPHPSTLVERLSARFSGTAEGPEPGIRRVPTRVYTDAGRFEQERDQLFLRLPLLVAHESQLPKAGDTLVHDWLGLPLVTLRDVDGSVRTFLNVCRHRGMRLLQDPGITHIKSFVCPYHQWTYGLDGRLKNIPLIESFGDIDPAEHGLVPVPTEVRSGLVWVQATPRSEMNLDAHLAGLDEDFERFGLADACVYRQSVKPIRCNWKLIQDAFLDGYHVVRLHRKTVGPYFPDSLAESDDIGRHIRSAVARNEIAEAAELAPEQYDLRRLATFSYTIFPNVVLICHPDYTSIIALYPQSADDTVFVHTMLVPEPPESDQTRAHFDRSFELIDGGVFEAEDIFVSVGTQRGLRSGVNDALLFGAFEDAAARFHDKVDAALEEGA
jgi:Rieske 2Fe-2S family protein